MKKENNNNGNWNSSSRTKTRQQKINRKTEREEIAELQKEFLRAKVHKVPVGRSLAENRRPLQQRPERSGDFRPAEIDQTENQEGKGESIPVLSDGRLSDQIVTRSRSGGEENQHRSRLQEQEARHIQRQITRASMEKEERQTRRRAFRILGGIWHNRNGRIEL